MNPDDLVRDALNADALGLTDDEFDTLTARVLAAAEAAAPGEQAAQAYYALAYLFTQEMRFISRQVSSGSGAEGAFAYSELSARLARATADRDAAQASYDRIMVPPVSVTKSRGSGSVPIEFLP